MEILILLTALLFYFVGYYAGRYHDVTVDMYKARRKLFPKKGGVINYITPDQAAYRGSEQEKIDKQQEKLLKESGII